MRYAFLIATAGLSAFLLAGCGPSAHSGSAASATGAISGSGSSFIKPIMDKWIEDYTRNKKGTQINYQSQGSSAGVKQMEDKATDFGCSDAFIRTVDLRKAEKVNGPILHIPMVLARSFPPTTLT